MANNVIPFGKYKDQPLEVLLSDPNYVQWLVGQPWVREKYPEFHLNIVNNNFFGAPVETPEHNALQVLFLDDAFCLKFCRGLSGEAFERETRNHLDEHQRNDEEGANKEIKEATEHLERAAERLASHIASEHTTKEKLEHECERLEQEHTKLEIEHREAKRGAEAERNRLNFGNFYRDLEDQKKRAMDQSFYNLKNATNRLASYDQNFASEKQRYQKECDETSARIELLNRKRALLSVPITDINFKFERKFEERGIDVQLIISTVTSANHSINLQKYWSAHYVYNVEIKPTVGDDYPAVLRQMRANGSRYLFVQDYVGTGATREQFIATFKTADIKVVFRENVKG